MNLIFKSSLCVHWFYKIMYDLIHDIINYKGNQPKFKVFESEFLAKPKMLEKAPPLVFYWGFGLLAGIF